MDINATHPYAQKLFKFFVHNDRADAIEWIADAGGVIETASNKLNSIWHGNSVWDKYGRVFYSVAYFRTEEDLIVFKLKFSKFIASNYPMHDLFNEL